MGLVKKNIIYDIQNPPMNFFIFLICLNSYSYQDESNITYIYFNSQAIIENITHKNSGKTNVTRVFKKSGKKMRHDIGIV